ncbi:MAG: P-loop containing nucleoside triphosphate hydrolase protein [Monoraphidium minutum]|nr:MAG: P-loop containing nucleoside triphosphate hydrolase protein [Monoraphidium minutum]
MAEAVRGGPPDCVLEMIEEPSSAKAAPVLAWRDLTVTSKASGRVLLQHLTGAIDGGFNCIMGPSGCGKSTLLNALSLRLDPGMALAGDMRINGQAYSNADLKLSCGYVMQDDLLNASLTVEETLMYTARLRCPPNFTDEERQQRVEAVLQQVGLAHVRDVIVGSPLRKGVSGGERKRLCVGMELLTEPVLLFLDEPTSGLDSTTALSLCRLLRRLADCGACTVIATLHQPQTKIFLMFEGLILLRSGGVVYQGPAAEALAYFEDAGHKCPELTNPADFLMDVIMPNDGGMGGSGCSLDEKAAALRRRLVSTVSATWREARPPVSLREAVPWRRQFATLLERSLREQVRRRNVLLTQLAQSVVMAVLIGTVFLHIGTSQASARMRQPVLFFCVINQGMFGALQVINSFPSERVLALRERSAGTYHASAYFLAKITAESLAQLPMPLVFSAVVYWLIGLQPTAAKFFVFAAFVSLCSLSATSLALCVGAWCRTTDMSVTVLPMALEICRLFGGFFLPPANMPRYFVWLDALSYVKYSYEGVSINELKGLTLTCAPSELAADGSCPLTQGEQVLEKLGINIPLYGCALALVGFIVLTRALAYVGIRVIKW